MFNEMTIYKEFKIINILIKLFNEYRNLFID